MPIGFIGIPNSFAKRAMKFVQVGSCEMDSPGAVAANPFFIWRESLFSVRLSWSAPRTPRDRSAEKIVEGLRNS
jgi:hypothetical protein